MFSALKFIAAGVIVALFGGFLLTGTLMTPQGDEALPAAATASPEPEATTASEPTLPPDSSIRTDILPGVALTVEEVEPDVLRVLSDAVRDVVLHPATWPVAGKDGGIWMFDEQGFSRVGTDGSHGWPNDKMAQGWDVAPDGTVWTAHVQEKNQGATLRIRSFDGETWTLRRKAADTFLDGHIPALAFTITSDGEVWTSWTDPDADTTKRRRATVVARLGADGWEPLAETIETTGVTVPLFVTDAGEVWATPFRRILRYTDGDWEPMSPEGFRCGPGRVDVGRDGTVWCVSSAWRDHADWVDGCPKDANCLMRYDGTEWQGWAGPDGLLEVDWAHAYPVHAAPDGSLWVIGDLGSDSKDGGIARFDGSEWRYFLTGRHVWAMDVAADGTVWLVVDSDEDPFDDDGDYPGHLYVITPEAMGATE